MVKLSRVAVLLALVVTTGACRKSISNDYVQAAQLFDALRAKRGAEAARDPQMVQVEALLRRVPEDSLSRPAAQALQKRIDDERAGLAQTQSDREKAALEAVKPPDVRFSPSLPRSVAVKEPPAEALDGGSAQPVAGMSLTEFSQRFSGCFVPDGTVDVLGKGKLEAWTIKDIANCRDRHPGFDGRLILVEQGQIMAAVDRATARAPSIPDGGAPKAR